MPFSVVTNASLVDVFQLASFGTLQQATAYARNIAPLLRSGIPGNPEVAQTIVVIAPDGSEPLVIDLVD